MKISKIMDLAFRTDLQMQDMDLELMRVPEFRKKYKLIRSSITERDVIDIILYRDLDNEETADYITFAQREGHIHLDTSSYYEEDHHLEEILEQKVIDKLYFVVDYLTRI